MKILSLLCIALVFVLSNVYAQENPKASTSDEEIKKYEVRGVMDAKEPSVSIYYEGEQLGWLKPGQKKGKCLLKAYDKETKEAILEISGKEYRLREGTSGVSEKKADSEDIDLTVLVHKRALELYDKDKDGVISGSELLAMVDTVFQYDLGNAPSGKIFDLDNDEKVSKQEIQAFAEYAFKRFFESKPDSMYKYDIDGDGSLSPEEVRKGIKRVGLSIYK